MLINDLIADKPMLMVHEGFGDYNINGADLDGANLRWTNL